MDALLEAAAEDIKLIDCLGPEDLCLDPSSADGLKPLQSRGLRSRSNRTAPAGNPPAQHSPQPPSRRRLVTAGLQQQEPAAVPTVQYGSANATLAAALLAGDFYAPESPAPVSKRPAHTPAQTASPKPVRPVSKKPSPESDLHPTPSASPRFVRPAMKKPLPGAGAPPSSTTLGAGSVALAGGNANARTPHKGSSAQPVTRVQRFGASILHYLHDKLKAGKKETLESVIRRDFGNNPDISKALRMLVAEKNVMRVGKGGRADPFTYQLALVALQKVQGSLHSSESEQAVSDRHDPSAPPGEAAVEADMGAVTESQGHQPLYIPPEALELNSAEPQPALAQDQSLSALLLDAPKDKQAPHGSHQCMVSELPICSASLRRSASLPNNLVTLPAAAETPIPDSAMPAAKASPYNSLAVNHGKQGSLSGPESYSAKGMSGADNPNPSWKASNEVQSAHSLPTLPAAKVVVAPSDPIAPSATAAVGSVLDNLPRNIAAGTLYRSAFQPYNSKDPSQGSKATTMADNTSSSQLRLACIPGREAGKHDHTGQGNKEPISDDKENVLPAAAGGNRLESQVSMGMDSLKASDAINTSAVNSTRQSWKGADGQAEDAFGGGASAMREMASGANGMPLGYCGAETTEFGDSAASKRAKFTHDFD
ncbi:hypothetical protein ABBQ32_006710 [Trebouxia sp. C0010 RCD-2024]